MNRKEAIEYSYSILKGILLANSDFSGGRKAEIRYDFGCREYEELRKKYRLKKIAGAGSEFERAKRLMAYFSAGLTHNSLYDNHVPANALALLQYSFRNPEHGINCLTKAKILTELCLAIGIKARRVRIFPYSVYDTDSHVVTEIYDSELENWIMLDPTSNGYFINGERMPLSMLEIRNHFAENLFITLAHPKDSLEEPEKLRVKYLEGIWYICKNSFRFEVERYQGFGEKKNGNGWMDFAPAGFSVKKWRIANLTCRIETYKDRYPEIAEGFAKELASVRAQRETPIYGTAVLQSRD